MTATVLITGGSSGIGLGYVKEFLSAGARVVIAGRRVDALKEVVKQYPTVQYIQADVSNAEAREKLIEEAFTRFPEVGHTTLQLTALMETRYSNEFQMHLISCLELT